MLRQVEEKGILARCRACFALNPNPQKQLCWQCSKDTLRCPRCRESPFLRYEIELGIWKCPNAACGKKFTYAPKRGAGEPSEIRQTCPKCGRNLSYDSKLSLWRCETCKRVYADFDLRTEQKQKKKASGRKAKAAPGSSHSYELGSTSPPSKVEATAGSRSGSLMWFIRALLVIGLVAMAIAVYYLFVHQTTTGMTIIGLLLLLAGMVALLFWIIKNLRRS